MFQRWQINRDAVIAFSTYRLRPQLSTAKKPLNKKEEPDDENPANSGDEDGEPTQTEQHLSTLDLALRLHRQVTLALEAGKGDRRSEMQPNAEGKVDDEDFGLPEEEESEKRGKKGEGCGKRLSPKASAADILRHKKHCK